MIEEKDFILREVQRLTLLLQQLISKISGLDSGDISIKIKETDEALKSEFDLSIKDISEIPKNDFLRIVKGMNDMHIEKLIELVFEVIKKIKSSNEYINLDEFKLIEKNLLLIDALDKNSKTFSMDRMNMKNVLLQW